MATYALQGKVPDQTICEDTALPNATTARIADVQLTLDAKNSRKLWVRVYAASTTVELAGGAALSFFLKVGATAAACSTVLPVSWMATQAVTTTVSWTSGKLMAEFAIPSGLLGTAKYAELWAITTADESADKIDAYLFAE